MKRCLQCASPFASDSWECPSCRFAPVVDEGILVFAPDLAREIAGYETRLFERHGGEQAERSFWTPARAALIVWALGRYVPRARRFLEIGCGEGFLLSALNHGKKFAVDLSIQAIDAARARAQAQFSVALAD